MGINTPTGWDDDLKLLLEWLTDEKKDRLFEMLKQEKENRTENEIEDFWNIPQSLQEYRKAREKNIRHIPESTKKRIIEIAKKIPLKVEVDSDGSRLITIKMDNKTIKILDPKLETHTDNNYVCISIPSEITSKRKSIVDVQWMLWDNVDEWKNQKLKEYVKQKEGEWLHIPKIEEIKEILKELWEQANLDEQEQILMFMYLTGMDWGYRLSACYDKESWNESWRISFLCDKSWPEFYTDGSFFHFRNLCMIAFE